MADIVVNGSARRATLSRTLKLACGCVIELPVMDSKTGVIGELVQKLTSKPHYTVKCNNDSRHRELSEVVSG